MGVSVDVLTTAYTVEMVNGPMVEVVQPVSTIVEMVQQGPAGAAGSGTPRYMIVEILEDGPATFNLPHTPIANSVRLATNGLDEYDFDISGSVVTPGFGYKTDDIVQIWWTS